jgi:hypothetical protein
MSITLYSYLLKREVPLLTDEEFRPIGQRLTRVIERIKAYRQEHGVSLAEANLRACDDAVDLYERMTGVRLDNWQQLYSIQLSKYGRPCPQCDKPFRTPRAKMCIECGFTLPTGEVAGPAELALSKKMT